MPSADKFAKRTIYHIIFYAFFSSNMSSIYNSSSLRIVIAKKKLARIKKMPASEKIISWEQNLKCNLIRFYFPSKHALYVPGIITFKIIHNPNLLWRGVHDIAKDEPINRFCVWWCG